MQREKKQYIKISGDAKIQPKHNTKTMKRNKCQPCLLHPVKIAP